MKINSVFSGFSVDDQEKAKEFYSKVLGFDLIDEEMGLRFRLPFGATLFVYGKDDHQPATFTVLNLVAADIDETVDELREKGVTFEFYKNLFENAPQQDEKGIMRSPDPMKYGPSIAWFKDPAGNILSVIQDTTAAIA
jgi:catechol 2,3-dioxygenase-like lactoylglutathione lyase family enzyme